MPDDGSAGEGAQALDPEFVAQLLPFDPFDPAFRADPYPVYRKLLAAGPVTRTPLGLWAVMGHRECSAVLRDPRFGHGDGQLVASQFTKDADGNTVRPFIFADPPDHTRIRSLVTKAFSARMVQRLRPRAEQLVTELLAAAGAADGAVDLMSALAYPLSDSLIGELLGVPHGDQERFRGWSKALGRGLDPDALLPPGEIERREHARAQFHEYFTTMAADRRAKPGEDLVSALVAVEEAGDTLTETELVITCTLLLSAGYATTVNLIGNGALALLRNPGQLGWLRANPGHAPAAIEELLRYDPPVQMIARVALEDAAVGDATVAAGEPVLLLIGAANRDPAVYADPDRLDLTREPNRNLGFGLGIHFCVGAPLARLTAQVAIGMLARLEIEPAIRDPRHNENLIMRGLAELPVLIHGPAC
jgi:cytochrome P450